jgi:hypothetical protein
MAVIRLRKGKLIFFTQKCCEGLYAAIKNRLGHAERPSDDEAGFDILLLWGQKRTGSDA